METLADRVALVQAELTRLTQDLHALPADAWRQPSACTQWQIQDVVAHVTGAAEFYIDTLSRGLQGDPAPSAGFPAAGTVNAAAMAEPIAQMALATREQPAPQVLATFEATLTRLHALLAAVGPHDWERSCYHPWRLMPVRYRFEVTGAVPSLVDVVVEGDHASIAEAGDTPASVTFHCDPETYVLVMYGRLSLEAARAMGRLRVEGDQALSVAFGQWFKGA